MDGEQWLDSYRARLTSVGERAARAREALAGVEATASSRDGSVTVTVNPAGALLGLVLGERSEAMSRVQLAAAVLAAAQQAQADAARLATDALAPLLGEDSEAMRVVRSHLPVPGGAP